MVKSSLVSNCFDIIGESEYGKFVDILLGLPRQMTCLASIILYTNHLNTGRVQYLNGRFVSGCQMVLYSSNGLKTGLKKACIWLKYYVFEWSAKSHDFTT